MPYRRLLIALFALSCLVAWPARALGPATKLTVTPSSLTLTADQTVSFVVVATDASNSSADVTSTTTFTTLDPRGHFTGAAYSAGKVGSWSVTASFEGLTATVPVTITAGALSELVINPNSAPEVVALNKTTKFSVTGFDSDNNKLATPVVTWTTTGNIGSVATNGVFTPSKEGTGTVVATNGSVTTNVAVEVVAARVTPTTNQNTNTAANTNTIINANQNTNTPATTNLNTAGSTDDTTVTDTTTCSTRTNWLWGILLLALLGGVAILYAFVPMSKIWPGAVGLGLALILSIVERSYGCADNGWWPWVALIGTAGLTLFAYQQSPKTPPQFPPKN